MQLKGDYSYLEKKNPSMFNLMCHQLCLQAVKLALQKHFLNPAFKTNTDIIRMEGRRRKPKSIDLRKGSLCWVEKQKVVRPYWTCLAPMRSTLPCAYQWSSLNICWYTGAGFRLLYVSLWIWARNIWPVQWCLRILTWKWSFFLLWPLTQKWYRGPPEFFL